jgi:hypothetical protein
MNNSMYNDAQEEQQHSTGKDTVVLNIDGSPTSPFKKLDNTLNRPLNAKILINSNNTNSYGSDQILDAIGSKNGTLEYRGSPTTE